MRPDGGPWDRPSSLSAAIGRTTRILLIVACCGVPSVSAKAETVERLQRLLAQKDAELAKRDATIKALEEKLKKVSSTEVSGRRATANRPTARIGFNGTPRVPQGFAPRDTE